VKPISYDKYYWQNDLVRVRAGTPEDWEEAYPSYFDSEARFLLQEEIELPPVEATAQEQSRQFAGFSPETGRLMFTIETLDGTAVGGLNLNSINERNGTFSIGIQIWVGYRGRGYGTAAMRILLRYAFLERRLNKFNSGCVEGNVASTRMHEKLGCVQEGVRRQVYYSGGRYLDGILFGLTKDESIENERRLLQT
jgi:RimJ/RimL family protein N-acetyltransferase